MPISGFIAASAQEAYDQVRQRRLQEETRRAIEAQQAAELQLRREAMEMQREQAAALEQDRAAQRAHQQGQVERADAATLAQNLEPGTEATAAIQGTLSKHPGYAGLVAPRKIIDARPIPGTAPLDTSGPQTLPGTLDYMGTPTQVKEQRKVIGLQRIADQAATANEPQRRVLGLQAAAAGLRDLTGADFGPTESEKRETDLQTTLAQEGRAFDRSLQLNAITNAQQNTRQAISDQNMRERAEENRDAKPPTIAQSKLAGYAARMEQAETTLLELEKEITSMNPASFEAQVWVDQPYLQSAAMQRYMQAARNLNIAKLRDESGAVISPTEFAEARKQYLPTPGDTPENLKQKRENRMLNLAMYRRAAGRAYSSVEDALAEAAGGGVGPQRPAIQPGRRVQNKRTGEVRIVQPDGTLGPVVK